MNSSLIQPEVLTTINPNCSLSSTSRSRLACYLVLSLVILFFALIRYRLREMPLERDEGEYAYAGQLLLQGVPPYQIAYNMKLPGTYVAYALMMAVFGQKASGIHFGLLAINALTTLLVFLLARKFFQPWSSLTAAASYALLSTSPTVLGFEGHATHFVVLCALAGLLVLLNAFGKKQSWQIFIAGFLLGLAFLMKQPGIFFPAFGLVYLLYSGWRSDGNSEGLYSQAGAYIVGAGLPFTITCLLIYLSGSFRKFWFWTFSYARAYVTTITFRQGVENFRENMIHVARPCVFIWLIGLAGLVFVACGTKRTRSFCYGLLLFSFFAVCPGLYFRPHYFLVLLPALSLLIAAGFEFLFERMQKAVPGALTSLVPAFVFLLAFSASIFSQREFLFKLDPVSACRAIYPKDPFPELVQVARYIQSQTTATQPFEVLGADPQTYFYANRRSVSGFMYIYPLTEDQPYALPMQQEVIADIERASPQFIVWVYDWDIPATGPKQLLIRWMAVYLHTNYDAVGVVMQPGSGDSGTPGRTRTPMIAVFRRRT